MRMHPHNAPPGYVCAEELRRWRIDGTTVDCEMSTGVGEPAHFYLTPVSASIWRATFVPPGAARPEPGPMVVPATERCPAPTVDEDADGISVAGQRFSVRIARRPLCVQYLDSAGDVICRQNPADVDGLGRPFVLPLGYVERSEDGPMSADSFHLAPDEHLFGLGEKFTPLDKTRQRIVSWTQDAYGSTSERSHKNIPMVWSTRGYGIFLDCTARITWELGTVSTQSFTICAASPVLDMYIIYGPAPAEILRAFADLTGHAPVPPEWSFSLWMSSGGTYRDRQSIERLVGGLEQNRIHAGVIHIDPWWMRWRRYCDFVWDETAFPDHQGLIRFIHDRSLRLGLWEHPYVSVESELFRKGKERGYFAMHPDGSVYVIDYGLSLAPRPDGIVRTAEPENSWNARVAIIDLTNPDAVEWFKELHRPLLREGVDLFKTDFGEDIPENARFFNGETGRTIHNLYPLLYNRAVYEVTEEVHGTGIIWSRSGTAGNQRYPVCWSGDPAADFDSLAATIRGGLSAGMSGIPFWSNDIGGYRGRPSEGLYIRWAQFGLLCSHARMHGDSPREPWAFGEKAVTVVRKMLDLRTRLLPYYYSAAHEAARSGLPFLRALPLAFPDDPNVYDKDFEFLVGPMFLAAPVIDKTNSRNVYIPAGAWINWWTGKVYRGPMNVDVSAPIDEIPLFVRGGGIVPMCDDPESASVDVSRRVTMHVFPHGASGYELIDDAGIRSFSCACREDEAIVTWSGGSPHALRFHMDVSGHRCSIEADGAGIQDVSGRISADRAGATVKVPPSSRGHVKLSH